MNNPWIWRPRQPLSAKFRLICFAHAGGTANAFKSWASLLPEWIDLVAIQFPGRLHRTQEAMPTRMGVLVRELIEGIEPELDLPFAFVGSCTGSLIAYELTQLLQKRELPMPSFLFAASCRAPHMPDRDKPIHGLSDDDLLHELSRLGGTGNSILAHPEMMKVFGPALRCDFELAETYTYRSRPPLMCPIVAFGGDQDPIVLEEELNAWQQHTQIGFTHQTLQGGHYLVEDAAKELCLAITQNCKEVLND